MKQGLSEKSMAALFVFPALLIILVIAIWPVLRSFWLSLYDVRLNNPTKTQVYHHYGIDLEKFASVYPLLRKNLAEESKKSGGAQKGALEAAGEDLSELRAELDKVPGFQGRYDQVDQLLLDGSAVPDELKDVELDEVTAKSVKTHIEAIQSRVKEWAAGKQVKDDNLTGLANGLAESLITPNFVGFKYYLEFARDGRLWDALGNTAFFTTVSVFLELVFGMAIALLINRAFFGRGVVRAAVLVPWAIPTVISALMWKFMFDGQNGIVAKWFEIIGIVPDMGELLTTKAGSMFAVIFADVWKTTPFMALLLLAGLQTIPSSLYEAANVDGASKVQQFFHITLPLMKSTILVALLFRTLDAFRIFDLIYVLTGGGPANSTETITIYAYKTMFAQMDFGRGSALSVVVFLCVAIISILFVRWLGTDLISDGRDR
jgi:multiple sugar transport system permease protein